MAAGPIVISILANASQANATLNSTATTTQKVGAGFRRMAAPAAGALAAIAAGSKVAIDAASDLSESVSKNTQIFGPQSKQIEKFAAGAATKLGQSKTAALDALGTFGLIGQKAGLAGKETAAFASQFTGLASDLASFNNTTPEEAVQAIGAAMRGESEPIRKYGVLLDDATLRARALKMGIIDNVKSALTPQQKALAASREILAQTSKAQGDFARTSDGAANKARILAARSENLQAKLGSALLPTYVKLQGIALKALGWMSKHTSLIQKIAIVAAVLAGAILAVNVAMAAASAVMAIFNAVLTVVRVVTTAARIAMFAFNVVMLANPVVLIVAAVVALIAVLVLFFTKTKLGQKIIAVAWAAIKIAVAAAGKAIGKAIDGIVAFVKKLVAFVRIAVVNYVAIWRLAIGIMADVLRAVIDKVKAVITEVGGLAGRIKSKVTNFGKVLYKAGQALIQGLIDGLKSMYKKLGTTLADISKFIQDHKGPIEKDRVLLTPAGVAIMDSLIEGIAARRRALGVQLRAVTRQLEKGINPAGLSDVLALGDPTAGASITRQAAAVNYHFDVRLDSRMTEAQMGSAYARAIAAAKRQGLIP